MKNLLVEQFRSVYGRVPDIIGRAPGRIEVIGNHTDYNGGAVLGAAINHSIYVGLSLREDDLWQFHTNSLSGKVVSCGPEMKKKEGDDQWVNYPLGVLDALMRRGLRLERGFDFAAVSDLPMGAGLSSSAAMELASAIGFGELYGMSLDLLELAAVGREAENDFVGVPCGILDQSVSAFGKREALVHIDCKENEVSRIGFFPGVGFWVFNTKKKHALVDSLYSVRHDECQRSLAGLQEVYPDVQFLAEATIEQINAVGSRLSDEEKRRAMHVVTENLRVHEMCQVIKENNIESAGKLLLASHESSRNLFENTTEELDFLVEQLSSTQNVYGARLTGGGFGGAAIAMTNEAFTAGDAEVIAAVYAERFGEKLDVFPVTVGDGVELLRIS
jgi:galactokinase